MCHSIHVAVNKWLNQFFDINKLGLWTSVNLALAELTKKCVYVFYCWRAVGYMFDFWKPIFHKVGPSVATCFRCGGPVGSLFSYCKYTAGCSSEEILIIGRVNNKRRYGQKCAGVFLTHYIPVQVLSVVCIQGGPKKVSHHSLHITLLNTGRFSKFFHCHILQEICNKSIIKQPTSPQKRCYTTLWNIYLTRRAWQSQTWGRPAPQVQVQNQFRKTKFLSQ